MSDVYQFMKQYVEKLQHGSGSDIVDRISDMHQSTQFPAADSGPSTTRQKIDEIVQDQRIRLEDIKGVVLTNAFHLACAFERK